jgi:hypothetical protein
MKKLRRITEAEVIAEFLKAEFFYPEYSADRKWFADIVGQPDFSDEVGNRLRRALLFRRRNAMWKELPEDRQWWEVELEANDVERVRVFPRAHWRKLAQGNFSAPHVAESVRRRMEHPGSDRFADKMAAICAGMQAGAPMGLVILIGIDEQQPITLLEGNHRFIASLLTSARGSIAGRHVIGGFSPDMEKCCWYKTNFQTLLHYLKNRIQHYWARDPDIALLLEHAEQDRRAADYAESAPPIKTK